MNMNPGLDPRVMQWRSAMLRFAQLHIQPREDAEDAVQDALLAVLASGAAGPAPGDVRSYLFGVLKHKITDRLRARYRHGWPSSGGADDGDTPDALDETLFDASGHWAVGVSVNRWHCPQSRLEGEQFFAVVDACIEHLPRKTAQVFSMKELLDCDADEVCATLTISKSDYWQCMSRARKQIQLCLTQRWFEGQTP